MEDGYGEGADSSGGRIFFRLGRKLSSQAKVDGTHTVESWVSPPHGRKELSHGADVLLHASLVDGLVVRCQDTCADIVSEDLQEGDLVFDVLEVVWNVQPCAEGVPLFSRCVVLA